MNDLFKRIKPLARWRPEAGLVLVYWVSRLGLALGAGLRFEDEGLGNYWQFLDPRLLREDLVSSLYHLHCQPPLFNLLLGLGLQAGGAAAGALFSSFFHAASLLTTLGIRCLARRLGAGPRAAWLAAAVFALSPSLLLFENLLFYPVLEAALLLAACLAVFPALERPTPARLLRPLGALALLSLLRPGFHLVWLLGVASALAWAAWPRLGDSRQRRLALAALAMAVLPPSLLYAKNLVVFGAPFGSSWAGMNLARGATARLPETHRRRLAKQGGYSALLPMAPFQEVASYPESYRRDPAGEFTHPALASAFKSTGAPNFNHFAYLAISRDYLSDWARVAREYPLAVMESVGRSWERFREPSTSDLPLEGNRARLWSWERLWNPILGNRLVFGWLSLLSAGFLLAASRRSGVEAWRRVASGHLLVQLLFVTAVSCIFEQGENARFKFTIEPLLWAVAAAMASAVWGRVEGILSGFSTDGKEAASDLPKGRVRPATSVGAN